MFSLIKLISTHEFLLSFKCKLLRKKWGDGINYFNKKTMHYLHCLFFSKMNHKVLNKFAHCNYNKW